MHHQKEDQTNRLILFLEMSAFSDNHTKHMIQSPEKNVRYLLPIDLVWGLG